VRARGLRGAAGRGRRAPGAGRPAGAPTGAGATPPLPADLPRIAAELIAAQFDTVAAAAEGCDALLASGLLPAAAGARSVAEKLGLRYVYAAYCPIFLPSPHHSPTPFPGRPFPPDVTDNRVLWDLQDQSANELFGAALNTRRASIGLPPVDNVYDYGFTDHPWLAADPTLGLWQEPADLDVVQTGAWILPDERPFPARAGGVPGRRHTTGVRGLRQHARPDGHRPGGHRGDPRAGPSRARCPRLGRPGPDRRPGRIASVSTRSTSRHCSPGWPPSCTTAAPGRRRRPPRAGAPQVVIHQMADQPYWAGRVADLGVGAAHDGPTPTAESLSDALRTALAPETRARAIGVAGTIRTDGATVAAKLLLDAVSQEWPPASA
jgi:vancomycin aglycone glucosyltransferase